MKNHVRYFVEQSTVNHWDNINRHINPTTSYHSEKARNGKENLILFTLTVFFDCKFLYENIYCSLSLHIKLNRLVGQPWF